MRQSSFGTGFEKYHRATRKQKFLKKMDSVIPWRDLVAVIKPHYPRPKGAGRKPKGIEKMLRIYFLQHWFQLSDPGAEEALYDSIAFREFVGIDLGSESVPDETTILKFRHLMEVNGLGRELFEEVASFLEVSGIKVERGTIVDATIINAPSSTKNKEGKRDPDMHQTRKGNQWYFGMKAHVGVDSKSKVIHSVVATPANVHDSQVLEDLLHGNETRVWGDSAYSGQKEKIKKVASNAKDFTNKKGNRYYPLTQKDGLRNKTKSKVRAKVEHVFHTLKRQFGFQKVHYRGLDKNANHLFAACALVNLEIASRHHLRFTG